MCRWQNTTGTLLQLATTWIHEAQASRGGDCRCQDRLKTVPVAPVEK
jgi:hypothetical protein